MTFPTMLGQLGLGMLKSCAIFFLTLLGALPLGLLVAFGRMSKWQPLRGIKKENSGRFVSALSRFKPVREVVRIYISFMRGTPLMLQLMLVYFGPSLLLGLQVGANYRFAAVIIGFVLNYAAYFAEIYRGGIESMAVGQYEAAEVLGYTRTQTFFRIILPQVVRRIIPSVTNEVITLVKDTSLAYAISYMEMFTLAKKIASSQTTLMPLVVAGVFYYIFNYIVAYVMERVEKRMAYYK